MQQPDERGETQLIRKHRGRGRQLVRQCAQRRDS